jgi:Domain of unknown function (DUF4124)
MKGVRDVARGLMVAAIFCGVSLHGVARTYKWVDDKGITHYGDTIPPEFKDKANAELSRRGITIKKTDQALTPEEIRARQEEEALAEQEELRAKEQKRLDQALLQTFTTEKDIELKRDRDLQQIELGIANNQSVLKSAEKRLAENRTRAEQLTKAEKPIPDGLKQDIESDERAKLRLERLIGKKREELGVVRAKYDDYKQRFAELQSTPSSARATAAATLSSPAPKK